MRRHSWLRVCAASLGLMLVLVVSAPAQSPSPSPSPEAIAAARDLLVAMRAADQFKMLLPAIMKAMRPTVVQNRPDVASDYDALVPKLLERASARIDNLLDRMAPIYARNFTVAELKDIVAFYRSPTGQRLVDRLPAIAQESMAAGQEFGRELLPELQRTMIEELREKGHTVADPAVPQAR
jgi:uncharacterized protein